MVLACDPDAGRDQVARVQRASEGVPLLIEEVLASPGVPDSFADTVRERLGEFTAQERAVIDAAAVLGRAFDWRLLSPMTGVIPELISRARPRGRPADPELRWDLVPVPARAHQGGGAGGAVAAAAPGAGCGGAVGTGQGRPAARRRLA